MEKIIQGSKPVQVGRRENIFFYFQGEEENGVSSVFTFQDIYDPEYLLFYATPTDLTDLSWEVL